MRFGTLYVDIGFRIEDKKGLVSQDSSAVEKENFDPVPRGKEPLIHSMSKICESEAEVVREHGCSAQTQTRIGLLKEIPRSGVQIPCLS